MLLNIKLNATPIFPGDYVYSQNSKRGEIWAESSKKLKEKVLAKGLPWNSKKVPKAKPVKITSSFMGAGPIEGSPAQFRLPWCQSNYKRY